LLRIFPLPTQFLGVADKFQPLSDLLKGKSVNSKAAIKWNDKAFQAFENIKEVLDTVSFLAYPAPEAEIALITDVSNLAIGAVFQQKVKN